jgi:hypothetical protein
MTPGLAVFAAGLLMALGLMRSRVGVNLSLSSVLLGMLVLLHGPAYWYYTRVYGPDTDFFEIVMSAGGDADVIGTLDAALGLGFLGVCLGILCADAIGRVSPARWRRAIDRWQSEALTATPQQATRLATASVVLAVGLLLPFIVLDDQLSKTLNYFTADLGEFEKIALRRESGGSESYIYNLMLSNVLPFLAFALLAAARAAPPRLRAWALGFIALVAIGKAATLSKAPLSVFALQCSVVWLMVHRIKLSGRVLLQLGVLATLLFMLMAWIANPSDDEVLLVLDFLFYRVFMIVNESLLEYFAAIPHVIAHSWGTQISWVGSLFQVQPSLPTYWLVAEVHRGVIGSTTTVMFVGDAWADFAWVGVVVVSVLIGLTVRLIDHRLIVRSGKSVSSIAGLALGHHGVFIAMSTSFQTALVTGGLIFAVPLAVLFASRMRRRPAVVLSPPLSPPPGAHA